MKSRALARVVSAIVVAAALALPGSAFLPPAGAQEPRVAADTSGVDSAATPAKRPPYVMPPLGKGLLDHPHNKLVHFPIVLGLGGFVLLALARRRPELLPVAHAVIWLAAASAVAAYFSGRFQEEEFKGRPKEWLGELHERASTIVTLACGAWALLVGMRPRRWGLAMILGAVIVAMMLGTGYLGGLLAHGRSPR